MKAHYDFAAATKNPYAKRLKQSVTIRLERPTLAYFKDLSAELGIPYQTLVRQWVAEKIRKELKIA